MISNEIMVMLTWEIDKKSEKEKRIILFNRNMSRIVKLTDT